MTKVTLHIGTPKTGTTAIQSALAGGVDLLREHNVHYLEAGRSRNAHNPLAISIRSGQPEETCQMVQSEMGRLPKGAKAIISSEMLSLLPAQKVAAAMPFLTELEGQIIIYLRRQDRYVEAFYKQKLKNGRISIPFDEFLTDRRSKELTDYVAILEDWAANFPNARIEPCLYEREKLIEQDAVKDFLHRASLPQSLADGGSKERNHSPSKNIADLLLLLRQNYSGKEVRTFYKQLKQLDLAGFSASNDLMSPSQARAFLKTFDTENEKLRLRYFADQPELFSKPSKRTNEDAREGFDGVQKEQLGALVRLMVKNANAGTNQD